MIKLISMVSGGRVQCSVSQDYHHVPCCACCAKTDPKVLRVPLVQFSKKADGNHCAAPPCSTAACPTKSLVFPFVFFFFWVGSSDVCFFYFQTDQEALVKLFSPQSSVLLMCLQTHFWWKSERKGSEPSVKIMIPAQFFHCLLTFRRGRCEAGAMINKIPFSASR